jgi:tetratricopeptide (TPR) repeat protein
MYRTAPFSALVALAVVVSPLLAQAHHCDAPGAGYVDPEMLERPPAGRAGIGQVSQRVTTSSADAQALYDQGLAYLHSYVWIEAARSFHQALRLDPDCAMAWVGLARAEQGLGRRAAVAEAIGRAKALSGKATDREQRFVALRAQQMEAVAAATPADEARLHDAYKKALEAAIATWPADAELWILRGNAEEPGPWGRGQRGGVGSIAYYETALSRSPGHFAAHHYLVHSYENVGRHTEAAEHGKIYAAAAPAVAHAQHMYAHVLPRLGRWEEAREQLEKADAIEESYAREERLRPGDDWHHVHNLQLLAYTELRLGRVAEAERTFRRGYQTPIRDPNWQWQHASLAEFLLLQGRAAEALAVARDVQSGSASGRAAGAAVEGEALLAIGRGEEARAAARRASEALAQGRNELRGADLLFFERMAGPFVRQIEALVALTGPRPEEGEAALLRMADDLAADPRFDAWGEGLFKLERVAGAARRLGRPDLAAQVEGRMRKIDPDYTPGSRSARIQTAAGR